MTRVFLHTLKTNGVWCPTPIFARVQIIFLQAHACMLVTFRNTDNLMKPEAGFTTCVSPHSQSHGSRVCPEFSFTFSRPQMQGVPLVFLSHSHDPGVWCASCVLPHFHRPRSRIYCMCFSKLSRYICFETDLLTFFLENYCPASSHTSLIDFLPFTQPNRGP